MKWTPHPTLKIPTKDDVAKLVERVGEERAAAKLQEIHDRREQLIADEKRDPLRCGIKLDNWQRMHRLLERFPKLLILGGNRSGKSESMFDLGVSTLIEGPCWQKEYERALSLERGVRVAYFHSSEQSSINQQQAGVHRFLPPEWRDLTKKTKTWHISYKSGSGFSNNNFKLPNGSECYFFHYTQKQEVFEGYEFDLVICDELVPSEFVELLEFRIVTRSGRLVLTFTPTHGFNATCRTMLSGCVPTETRQVDPELFKDGEAIFQRRLARNCPKGEVPVVMEYDPPGGKGGKAVFFYHSDGNPFNPYKNIVNTCYGKSVQEALIRAYGYTERTETSALANFSRKAHVITREKFEQVRRQSGGTIYVSADPGGAKNWFIKWYYVTPNGWTIVYREWPDYDTYGEWARPPKNEKVDWLPGPAQYAEAGGGIVAVKSRILELEGWVWDRDQGLWMPGPQAEHPELRVMDPRMGGMVAPSDENETSLLMLMEEEQEDKDGHLIGPSMYWEPAVAGGAKAGRTAIEISIEMLNTRMEYDPDHPVVIGENCPNWFVVEDCEQTIQAYEEFTGRGTDKDALKDIIDPDRYFVNSDLWHVEPRDRKIRPAQRLT